MQCNEDHISLLDTGYVVGKETTFYVHYYTIIALYYLIIS